MEEEYEEKYINLLLDFQGKDTSRFLEQPNMYFRILNLNEAKPIIEIGEDVYEASGMRDLPTYPDCTPLKYRTYDDSVGTNVYFEEVENPPPNSNVFEGATPITLQYLLKQTKILKMKKVGTKPKPLVDTNPTDSVNIYIKDDYRALLEKFENDKLNIEECTTVNMVIDEEEESELPSDKSDEEEQVESGVQWEFSQLLPRQTLEPEWFTSSQEGVSEYNIETQISYKIKLKEEPSISPTLQTVNYTYDKYIKLQKLAERPTKRKLMPETVKDDSLEPLLHCVPKNDFIVWKNLVMQRVEQQSVNLDINKHKIEHFVDIEESINMGVIAPSNAKPRIFTKEEKQELLSFKNFINVSPLMKLIIVQDYEQLEKNSMSKMNSKQLNEVGKDGCTVTERYKLLINFKDELEYHIIMRLQNDLHTEETENNLKFNLANGEETSDTDCSYSSDDDNIGVNDDILI